MKKKFDEIFCTNPSKKDLKKRLRMQVSNFSIQLYHAQTFSSGFVQYFIIRSYSYEGKPSFLESREISKAISSFSSPPYFRHSAEEDSSFDKIELKVSRVKGEPFTTKSGTTETLVGPRRGSQCLSHQPSTIGILNTRRFTTHKETSLSTSRGYN